MGKDTLGDFLNAKPDRIMKFEQLAQLLFDPTVLGIEGHKVLLDEIAIRNGRSVLTETESTEHDGMVLESLHVADAAGALAAAVCDAVDPDSPGGSRITQAEMEGIGASGRLVIHEACDMIPYVPGLHEVVA